MEFNQHKNLVWFVIVGLVGFIIFFKYYPQMDDFSNINLQYSKEDAQQKIEEISETYNLDLTDFKSTFVLTRNTRIVQHSQKKNGLTNTVKLMNENFPAYYWHAEFTKPREPGSGPRDRNVEIGGDERERLLRQRGERTITFDISTSGQLLKFEKIFPPDSSREQTPKQIDSEQAKKNLFSFIQPDTSGWELKLFNIDRRRRGNLNQFRWVTNKVEWADSLTAVMDFRGNELRRFNLSFDVDETKEGTFSAEDIFGISMVFFILIITIFILIAFIKRLRQDKIEFRNSWIIAILSAASIALNMISSDSDGSFLNLLLSVSLSVPFVGISVFVLSAVSESVSRDIWNEKLFSYDRILKGKIYSHRLGNNLVSGFFGGGLILGILTLFVLVFTNIGKVFFVYDGDEIRNFTSSFSFLKNISLDLIIVIFLFFTILVFFIPYLKRFFKNNLLFIVFAALVFSVVPLKVFNISPIFLRVFLNFLVGLVLMWLLIRFDYFTSGVSFLTVLAFVSAIPFLTGDSAGQIVNGLLTILFPLTFFAIGLIAIFSKEVKDDEKEYVPDYVIRSRERERFQRELEIARTVQLRFLPQSIPEMKWLDISSHCLPAYEVGGDYYDFLQLDEHRFGVVVGDVSGKGVSAAFYMTLMKGIIKSQTRHVQSPKEVLIQVNDLFYENAQRGVFISMIYGVFDQQKQTFSFARAGHNPLISMFRQKNEAEEISPKGIAIGLDKGLVFNPSLEESTISINQGDVFVFYTDGYSEAMDKNQNEFGEERLLEIINKNSNLTANKILNKIQEEIKKFTGKTPQHDDMTMVIVRICDSD
jgi:phosphoserine phosphatase RsbU/P